MLAYSVVWGAGVVICLEQGADLHMTQLMPLPLTVCCFSKIQIGFTFLVPAHLGSPGKRAVKRVCMCVCGYYWDPTIRCICCHITLSNVNVRKLATNDKLQGSVVTYSRCGETINNHIKKGLLPSLPVKSFKSVNIWQSYK